MKWSTFWKIKMIAVYIVLVLISIAGFVTYFYTDNTDVKNISLNIATEGIGTIITVVLISSGLNKFEKMYEKWSKMEKGGLFKEVLKQLEENRSNSTK